MIFEATLFIFAMNVTAFLAFAWDKHCARNGMWRLSEGALLLMALAGGSVGAITAQQWLRHKTRKEPFKSTLYLIAGVQIFLLVALAFPTTRTAIIKLIRAAVVDS